MGFVDADDYVMPEMFQRLYEAAEAHGADLVLSGIRHRGGILFDAGDREEVKCSFSALELFQGTEGRERLLLGVAGAAPEEPEDSRYGFSACKNLYRGELLRREEIRFLSEREWESEDVLFLLEVIVWMFDFIPFVGLLNILCIVGFFCGLSNALKGKRKPIPLIGEITLIN